MASDRISRRELLLYSSCAAVSAHKATLSGSPLEHQHSSGSPQHLSAGFQFFSEEDASDVDAIAELIIPADESPGAKDAGVVYFIDRALTTFDHDKQEEYRTGLRDLRTRMTAMSPSVRNFSGLPKDLQIKLLSEVEHSSFFSMVRTHTVMGFFGNESYGGNRHQIGWKLIGFENKFAFRPPFGSYDAEPNSPSR